MRKIKAVIFGAGNMGREAICSMLDHGVEITGAVGRKRNLGKDIGELAGREPIGVYLNKDAEAVLAAADADIAFVSTESGIEQMEPIVKLCADHGVNIITIAEAMNYPWSLNPEKSRELDEYCKDKGVTLYGTGAYDVFWNAVPISLLGGCNKVSSLDFYCILGLEDMGRVVAEELYVGKTVEEYKELIKETPPEQNGLAQASIVYITGNAAGMKLNPVKESVSMEPIISDRDVSFPQWDIDVKAGQLLGLEITASLETEEAVTFNYTSYFRAFAEDEEYCHVNRIEYTVHGQPEFHMVLDNMHGEVTTAYCTVNRLADVINAEPGLKTIVDMPMPIYHAKSMEEYLEA